MSGCFFLKHGVYTKKKFQLRQWRRGADSPPTVHRTVCRSRDHRHVTTSLLKFSTMDCGTLFWRPSVLVADNAG